MSADDARRRFDDATQRYLLAPLPGGIEVRSCSEDEWSTTANAWWSEDGRPPLEPSQLYSAERRAGLDDLDALLTGALTHRVLLWQDGAPIGAFWGQHESWGRYYMVNTIMRPDFRGRGVYRAFLGNVERAVAAAGFRELYSRHRADNNAVIVPKLKAGWVIAAFEVALKFGLMVHLRKYLTDDLVRLHGFRVDGGHAVALRAAGLTLP
jgi:hypothetical protein